MQKAPDGNMICAERHVRRDGHVIGCEVGIILTLEMSRLVRSNADLQRLLLLASTSYALILDEAGIYDLNWCNDHRPILPLCRSIIGNKG